MLNLEELNAHARKIIDLWRLLDSAFGNTASDDHLALAIMAGLQDVQRDVNHPVAEIREDAPHP